MKIIWSNNDPSMGAPDREELQAELAAAQESSPSGTPEDTAIEETEPTPSFIGFKGFGR
jgi:hypothetical protein